MSQDSRYGGFLTARDKKKLNEWDNNTDLQDNQVRQDRFNLRQRTARALRDLVLVERELPAGSDRELIFDTLLKPDLWETTHYEGEMDDWGIMRTIFDFLITSHTTSTSGDNVPDAPSLEKWIEHAVRQVMPRGYVTADIIIRPPEWLDSIEDKYRKNPDRLEKKELDALLRTGRISFEEYQEHGEPEGF